MKVKYLEATAIEMSKTLKTIPPERDVKKDLNKNKTKAKKTSSPETLNAPKRDDAKSLLNERKSKKKQVSGKDSGKKLHSDKTRSLKQKKR